MVSYIGSVGLRDERVLADRIQFQQWDNRRSLLVPMFHHPSTKGELAAKYDPTHETHQNGASVNGTTPQLQQQQQLASKRAKRRQPAKQDSCLNKEVQKAKKDFEDLETAFAAAVCCAAFGGADWGAHAGAARGAVPGTQEARRDEAHCATRCAGRGVGVWGLGAQW